MDLIHAVRNGWAPIPGSPDAFVSSITHEDAARAVVTSFDLQSGIYNITDDEPAPVSVWLPYLAEVLGAKPPRHVPKWLARWAVGEYGIAAMTELRGSSNRKAKSSLPWKLDWASWRRGFKDGFENRVQPISSRTTRAIA